MKNGISYTVLIPYVQRVQFTIWQRGNEIWRHTFFAVMWFWSRKWAFKNRFQCVRVYVCVCPELSLVSHGSVGLGQRMRMTISASIELSERGQKQRIFVEHLFFDVRNASLNFHLGTGAPWYIIEGWHTPREKWGKKQTVDHYPRLVNEQRKWNGG